LGCFVSLRTSSFRTNWYHLMTSSIRRHHWSSASILHVSVLDIAQQSEPYKNIGKMHVLYSFNFVEMASSDPQIWFSKLCMAARVMALQQLIYSSTSSIPLHAVTGFTYISYHQANIQQLFSYFHNWYCKFLFARCATVFFIILTS